MFKQFAAEFYQRNLPVIPLDGKGPVYGLSDWSKYCEKMPSDNHYEMWEEDYPNANIGLCCGPQSGVIAIDIDVDDEFILNILPPSPVRRFGAKGEVRFYNFNPNIESRKILHGKQTVVEVLTTGRQVVLPPSIHPDTKKSYQWITKETLTNNSGLPDLPDNITTLLDIIAERGGLETDKTSGGRHDKLLAMAFAAANNGESDEQIKESLIRYDNKHHEIPWFQDPKEKITPEYLIKSVRKTLKRKGIEPILKDVSQNVTSFEEHKLKVIKELEEEDFDDTEDKKEAFILPYKFHPPKHGLIKLVYDLTRSIDSTIPPAFGIIAAHTVINILIARKFRLHISAERARSLGVVLREQNIWPCSYFLAVAPSGFGKSFIGSTFNKIEENVPNFFSRAGGVGLALNGFSSGPSIITQMINHKVTYAKQEEFTIMLNKIRKGSIDISDNMCGAWTAASEGILQASHTNEGFKKGWKTQVMHPALMFCGFTTPTNFSQTLDRELFKTGFLSRFIVLPSGKLPTMAELQEKLKTSHDFDKMPELVNHIEALLRVKRFSTGDYIPGKPLEADESKQKPIPHEVKISDDLIRQVINWINVEEYDRMMNLDDHHVSGFVKRATQHVLMLALTHAVGTYDWAGNSHRIGGWFQNSWCSADKPYAVEIKEEDITYGYEIYRASMFEQHQLYKSVPTGDSDVDKEDQLLAELTQAGKHGKRLAAIGRHSGSNRIPSGEKQRLLNSLMIEGKVKCFYYKRCKWYVLSKNALEFAKLHQSAKLT